VNTRPTGVGWSVVATVDGFDVVDRLTGSVVTTAATRVDAWRTVTGLSNARVAVAA